VNRLLRKAFLSLLAFTNVVVAANWPQFRGPGMAGVSTDSAVPDKWGPAENVLWTAALPGRGVSSPILVGDRVFVTASSGLEQTRMHVLCFAADDGAKLWERQFWATGPTNCNPKTCPAAPTPVADGSHVFALFGSGDLVCLDHSGNLCWLRTLQSDYPTMVNFVGRAASPVLHNGLLIIPLENQGASFLLGLDAATGRNRWRVDRPLENSYTTPLLLRRGERTDLVIQAQGGLKGYDPATGQRRWEFANEAASAVASPVAAGDLVLSPGREMIALRLSAEGSPEVAWRSARLGGGTPTPLVADGRVYSLKDGGTIVCGNLETGKEIWTQRLRGAFSASPVLAGGKLYLVNEDGETTVLQTGDRPTKVSVNRLGGPMLATPAVTGSRLFLRSESRIYCVGR
jgi:outer membrane protein assembly factor BamB